MNAFVELMPTLNGIPYFGLASVTESDHAGDTIKVKAQLMGAEHIVQARIAVQNASIAMDDEVLIAGSNIKDLFVIGIISKRTDTSKPVLCTKTGAYATLSDNVASTDKALQVYSPRNELLFEYDPVAEKAKVNLSKGDLELCTEDGDIRLNSANAVQINSHSIDMNSTKLNANAGYARFVFGRLETAMDTLVEQAKNVYRTVKQLTQLRTGRLRTLVDETYQFKADKVFMKSEDDFKVKGEKIHLG
jgi:hypothetical protein